MHSRDSVVASLRWLASLIVIAHTGPAAAQQEPLPRQVSDTAVITTQQATSPVGATAIFDGRVHGVAFAQDPGQLWVAVRSDAGHAYRLSWKDNRVLATIKTGAPGLAAITIDQARGVPLETVVGSVRVAGGGERSTEQLI